MSGNTSPPDSDIGAIEAHTYECNVSGRQGLLTAAWTMVAQLLREYLPSDFAYECTQ